MNGAARRRLFLDSHKSVYRIVVRPEDTQPDGIGGVALLAELIIREEIDLDLVSQSTRLKPTLKAVVIDATVTVFWVVRL